MLIKILLFIIAMSIGLHLMLPLIILPSANNISLNDSVDIDNGEYKIEYPIKYNYFEFLDGAIEIINGKIISIEGIKKYDKFGSDNFYFCTYDLKKINESYRKKDSKLKEIKEKNISNSNIIDHFLSNGYHYIHTKCEKLENNVILSFSLNFNGRSNFILDNSVELYLDFHNLYKDFVDNVEAEKQDFPSENN